MTQLEEQKVKLEIQKLEKENIKLQKETEKLEEEKNKVEVEKKEILKPWYTKSAWWSIITTFLIGAGGFYIALQTNILGIQELKSETKRLQESIAEKKDSLILYKDALKSNKEAYIKISDSLKAKATELSNKTKKIQEADAAYNELRLKEIDQQLLEYNQMKNDAIDYKIPLVIINKKPYYVNYEKYKYDSTSKEAISYRKQFADTVIYASKKIDSLKRVKNEILKHSIK